MKYSLILLLTAMFFAGCGKELSLENGTPVSPTVPVDEEPAKETSRKYHLTAFYADRPIDFVENDEEIRSESDLWSYVNEYIKDDVDEFVNDTSIVLIHQNDIKIPGNDDPVLQRSYFI